VSVVSRLANCDGACATKGAAINNKANKISFRISIHQLAVSSSAVSAGGLKPVLTCDYRLSTDIHSA
jgi:hypothetical protein